MTKKTGEAAVVQEPISTGASPEGKNLRRAAIYHLCLILPSAIRPLSCLNSSSSRPLAAAESALPSNYLQHPGQFTTILAFPRNISRDALASGLLGSTSARNRGLAPSG